MENPVTWGEAEKVIRQVLHEDHAMKQDGQVVLGLSLERRIADALRAAGLLLADPAALDDDQLDAYFRDLGERTAAAVRENNRRGVRKLLDGSS